MKKILLKLLDIIPDFVYLKIMYYKHFSKLPNLDKPKTFNEKLQWLKLYDRNPDYSMMVDKYEVKQYISDTLGTKYVIPTLGKWSSVDDIDFDLLPNQFVLKCNHDSKSTVICKNKNEFDIRQAKNKLESHI